ncbi:MAG TPA: hypothetical protein VG102_03520 [Candidatus Paceibacterota bacterium]|jgi:hypothetical protein|nr:hypothetical protein [Candidatus Paceibacterota bacterium]
MEWHPLTNNSAQESSLSNAGATAHGRLDSGASVESIKKFRQLYLQEFGIELSFEEAAARAQQFLNVARVVMQPMPKRFENRYRELLPRQAKYAKTSNEL